MLFRSLTCRGIAAADGDPTTAWSTPVAAVRDQWIKLERARPFTLDHLDLVVVADARHSLPTRLHIALGGTSADVAVPPISKGPIGHRATVRVRFPTMHGTLLAVTISAIAAAPTHSFYAGDATLALPVAIAELEIGRAHV